MKNIEVYEEYGELWLDDESNEIMDGFGDALHKILKGHINHQLLNKALNQTYRYWCNKHYGR